MKELMAPLWYHPTNVLLLDDDPVFLSNLGMEIDPLFPFVIENKPQAALDYLQTHAYQPRELARSLVQPNFDFLSNGSGTETYNVTIDLLKGDLASPSRFKKIVVAVVDRYMPAMDGLEFCRKVREDYHLPVKLILLTGAMSTDEAIDAFNEGKIDAYIEKRSPKLMMQKVNEAIRALAWQQFQAMSKEVMGSFYPNFSHIADPKFFEQFEKIRTSEGAVEFYFSDASGSFLLLDKEGKEKLFLVRLEDDFNMMYDLAKDSGAFRDVLQGLRDCQQYPVTSSLKIPSSLKGDAWSEWMVSMQKIPGRAIFYSLIARQNENAMGFNQYIGEEWPRP